MQGRSFPAILQRSDDVIAGFEPERVEPRDERRDAAVPLRIGQAQVAVDDGKRVGVARHTAEKTQTKVKHATQMVSAFCRA